MVCNPLWHYRGVLVQNFVPPASVLLLSMSSSWPGPVIRPLVTNVLLYPSPVDLTLFHYLTLLINNVLVHARTHCISLMIFTCCSTRNWMNEWTIMYMSGEVVFPRLDSRGKCSFTFNKSVRYMWLILRWTPSPLPPRPLPSKVTHQNTCYHLVINLCS